MNSVSAEGPPSLRDRGGVATGLAAGLIAISCCVGPTLAALFGITSAAIAFDVATDLYDHWGSAFKLVGAAFAITAIVLTVRRRRACGRQPRVWRSIAVVALAGAITYTSLYWATTWLGTRPEAKPLPALH